jgi:hypothetical protein
MKYLFLFITFILIFAGCSKKEPQPVVNKNQYSVDTSDIKTTPVDNPNEAFTLKYSYEKGKKYEYVISLISSDFQSMKTDTTISQSVKQNTNYLVEITPVEIDQDGTMELNAVINSAKVEADANGKRIKYESGVSKDSLDKLKFAEYECLIKNPFSIRVSKAGEILDIFRADKITNKFLELKGYADSLNADQKAGVRKNMVEGLLRPLMNQIFRQVPGHTLAKDSTWSYPQPANQMMVFSVQNTNNYKILNLEKYNSDKLAVITGSMTTTITGNNKAVNQGVSYNFSKPVTSAGGKIYFDITKGCIIKSKTYTSIKSNVSMEGPSPKGRQKGNRSEAVENTYIVQLL